MLEREGERDAKAVVAARAAGATAFEMTLTAEEYLATARDAMDAVELDRSERFSVTVVDVEV